MKLPLFKKNPDDSTSAINASKLFSWLELSHRLSSSVSGVTLQTIVATIRRLFEILIVRTIANLAPTDLMRFCIFFSCTGLAYFYFTAASIRFHRRKRYGCNNESPKLTSNSMKVSRLTSVPCDPSGLCCAKAIVFALAHLEKNKQAINAMRDHKRHPALENRARELHRTCAPLLRNSGLIMGKGRKCCVPGYNSNYNNTDNYVSSFTFPKDEVRKSQWVKSINRADFIPSSTAVVCIKHFSSKFIIKEDRVIRDDGSELVVQRQIPKLSHDAYPSIFPNQPSYLFPTAVLLVENSNFQG
ncbi:hypothetical protein HNY73_007358 [Argiope bruennichi]|uniref:THAP-type domain-containing protein n=1 Tax=Argiope bruennichi TaxID=94029 RepID=A0A8T0FJ85_ARGBR|nr:hypothetical protein HNY73_007358 [Argiope bruennichi]